MAQPRNSNTREELARQIRELQERFSQFEAEAGGQGDQAGEVPAEVADYTPDGGSSTIAGDPYELGNGPTELEVNAENEATQPSEPGQILLAGFEVFTGRRTPISSLVPRASLQRRGNFSLNRAAYKALGEPHAVIFGWNPTAREIAIRAAPQGVGYAMPVRKQAAAASYLVAAMSFIASIGLNNQVDVLVFDDIEVRDDVLVLPVAKTRNIPTRRRNQAKKGEPKPAR
jgi:hypothetical protein